MNFLEEFQYMAQRHPEKAAIVDCNGERTTSYLELETLSRRIAAKLLQSGEISGRAVLVCMGRRMEYIAAEIGIMMAGGAFAPVLPEYPKERIEFIREDCQAAHLIDMDWLADIGEFEPAVPKKVEDGDRVFIIYTSGSTGRPKGIVHNMRSFTQGAIRNRKGVSLDERDVLAAMAPMSFVVLVLEYYAVLSSGACAHILPEEVRKDVRLLEDYYAEREITCGFISPQMLRLFKNKGTSLKKLMTGSERVSMLAGDGYDLYNFYGCSETAAMVAYYKIEKPMENTPIGVPGEGAEFFLLDDEGREVPQGEEGEICIRGYLASAYLNLEEQSAHAFHQQEDGKVILHTGDMGRQLPDGNYVYVNRKDWMVKVNGQRVETGEVEIRMASFPGVENAVVKAFEDEYGRNYLCGFFVSGQEVEEEELRTYLGKTLPDYMIPRFFKRLSSLPKNVNGKLDRTALLPPGMEEYKAEYREPQDDTQRRICHAFEEILGCGAVGLDDDFFRLGGDSINVLKLVESLDGLDLMPEIVLKGRTPGKIASLLGGEPGDGLQKYSGDRKEFPLTDAQMGVYLECVNEPEATMYNIPMCCELPLDIDTQKFQDAVRKAVAMYPSFGVNIGLSEGVPVMCPHPEYLKAEVGEWETEDIQAVKRTFVRPFSMEGEPLYRMALYRDQKHVYFLFDVHHLIFDGTSVTVFLDEISLFYKGEEPKAEEISLFDVSAYEETLGEKPRYQAAQEYFRKRLEGEDFGDSLLKDFKKKTVTSQSNEVRLSLGEEFSPMAVEQFARQKGISENTLFLGTFSYALGKYNGENKSLFCTVNNGRHSANMAQSTGMFVKTLPMYQAWEESETVESYLQDFQRDFYEIMGHDCISFGELARDYGIASDILFVYQGEMFSGLSLDGGEFPAQPLATGDVQADVSVMVMKGQAGYEVSLEYRRDLYREETARGLLGMFRQCLGGMLSCGTLDQISLASELDIQRLEQFNETEVAFDRSRTVVDLFREQARNTPGNTAVIYIDRKSVV